MQLTLSANDLISPNIRKMAAKLDGGGRKAVLTVMGDALRFWAMEAFTDEEKRPAPWADKMDGTPSTLQSANPTLRRSLRVEASANEVVVGSDRPYALIHQLGGEIRPKTGTLLRFQSGGVWFSVKKVTMPARPYLPITSAGGLMAGAAEEIAAVALAQIAEERR